MFTEMNMRNTPVNRRKPPQGPDAFFETNNRDYYQFLQQKEDLVDSQIDSAIPAIHNEAMAYRYEIDK